MQPPKPDGKPLRTVLVTRFSAMGDVAIAAGVMAGVCRANPHVRFVMVTRKSWAPMFDYLAPNLVTEPVDLNDYKGLPGLWRLAAHLHAKYGADTLADIHGVLRTRILDALLRLRGVYVRRIDKGRKAKKMLTRLDNKVMEPLPSSADRYHDVMRRVGLTVTFAEAVKRDGSLPEGTTLPTTGEIRVGVAPFAAHNAKAYPEEEMLTAIRLIADSVGQGMTLWLYGGGRSESDKLAQWAGMLNAEGIRTVNVAALKAGLSRELNLMATMDVMVTMDSGNMHLAALSGVPTVSIWCATHPYAGFTPLPTARHITLGAEMPCRPCSVFGNKPCTNAADPYACKKGVTPAQVCDTVTGILKSKNKI